MEDLRKENQIVICIGAGINQVPYIKDIISRGLKIICIDKDPNAPGFKFADKKIVSSTFDDINSPKLIKREMKNYKIKGVIAPCTGPPFRTKQKVMKDLGLQFLDNKKTDILLDKKLLRDFCNSIKISKIQIFQKIEKKSFPLVKKPRFEGMGGKDVEIFYTIKEYLEKYPTLNIDNDFVYEKFICGKEVCVDAIWNGEKIIFLNLGWTLFEKEFSILIGATSQRDDVLKKIESKIKQMLIDLCTKLSLGSEVLNLDIILDKNGGLHVIEVEFVPSDAIIFAKECFEYDLIKNFNSVFLNEKIEPQKERKKESAIVFTDHNKKNVKKEEQELFLKNGGKFNLINPYSIKTKKGMYEFKSFYQFSTKQNILKILKVFFPNIVHYRV